MTKKSETGKLGEDIACQYLLNKGFSIIERNYRKLWGELDIIAKDPEGTLVFVEVKAIRQFGNYKNAAILPEENLTAAKLKKLKRTASLYAGFNENLIDDERGWRIDLVAIMIPDVLHETLIPLETEARCEPSRSLTGLTELLKYCDIKHFENVEM
ncbi:MAG: YraN family protein [Candidatus Harrisonbacteria bacterium]|nr:YraN family protein [Candidatus Harrisonbacteria bacterium]